MRESTKVALIVVGIAGAFLVAGDGDLKEAMAQEKRASETLAGCMPQPGEMLTAEWVNGKLLCRTHVGGYGRAPKITGCNLVAM